MKYVIIKRGILEDYMYSFKATKAFTLAEVLVTLGIIGVVSAMTLPTLVKSHQRQVYVTQLHKVYNEFSQAGESYINSKNAINLSEAGIRTNAGIQEFVQSSIKTVKNCGSTFTDCFASEYQNMNGATMTNYNDSNASCYILPTGASVCLAKSGNGGGLGIGIGGINAIDLIVDTNSKQGPNILGRDLFIMAMGPDGSVVNSQYIYDGDLASCFQNYDSNTHIGTGVTPGRPESCNEFESSLLQRCQNAKDMRTNGAGAACFAQLQKDGWQMEY